MAAQVAAGNRAIAGVMLESFLVAGRQDLAASPLVYGQSITDACMDWDTTSGFSTGWRARSARGARG